MWLDELLKRINFSDYYPKGKVTGRDQLIVNCPFHDDKHASCSINTAKGLYYCHACGASGNFVTWAKQTGVDLKALAKQHGVALDEKTINIKTVRAAHKKLLDNKAALKFLEEKRGLNMDTIKKFKLGLYNDRLSIPITNFTGEIVNLRLYTARPKRQTDKIISYGSGYGSARLFPWENLTKRDIMICEGEMDCMLANQLGYNAITATTGAGTWMQKWNEYFNGKNVVIVYDIDVSGKQGAAKVADMLNDYANSIKIINLPINPKEIKNGDLTDYIISLGHTKDDLDSLIKRSPERKKKKEEEKIKYTKVPLALASEAKYDGVHVQIASLISGKDLAPYILPKHIKLTCSMDMGKMCLMCGIALNHDGEYEFDVDYRDPDFLLFLDNDNLRREMIIKAMASVPLRCNRVDVETIGSQNVERIILTPEIEYTTNINESDKYVTRTGYYIGHDIETNRAYNFKGFTLNHPKTQQATHIFTKALPAKTNIDNFEFTDKMYERLKKFQTDDPYKKFEEIYNNTIVPLTGIVRRSDLFATILLTYCSPLHFEFAGRAVAKGWLESLILGDTRTGKTDMMKSLIEYFKAGELVLGESSSFAGLMGGLQQVGSRWHLTWGRIPLNNGKLVAIDEMSGLSTYEISKLSGIRSSGIAEITKIRTERTYAKTRLIWMSNVRGYKNEQRRLASYTQGIRAVPELVGKQEDISRFDLVLLLGDNEVPPSEINKPIPKNLEKKYSSQDFHDLIMWAWKLKSENIIIDDDVLNYIYQQANELSKTYTESIPIVISSEQRIKLARIATAAAAATFSTQDGKTLVVEKHHVYFAVRFLRHVFDKPICAYDEYSRLEKERLTIKDRQAVIDAVKKHTNALTELLELETMTFSDMQEIFEMDTRSDTRRVIHLLMENRAIKRTGGAYEKTPAFIKLIREMRNGEHSNNDKPEPEQWNGEEDDWPF